MLALPFSDDDVEDEDDSDSDSDPSKVREGALHVPIPASSCTRRTDCDSMNASEECDA